MRPAAILRVITQRIVTKAEASVTVVPLLIPSAFMAFLDATISYDSEPTIERRSHGIATPRLFESATTPTKMATAGAIVKIAAEVIVFLIFLSSIPSTFARLSAFTRK